MPKQSAARPWPQILKRPLTEDEEHLITEAAAEWADIGLASGPGDREEAERGVAEAYEAVGAEPPKRVIWCASPVESMRTVIELGLSALAEYCPYPMTGVRARNAPLGLYQALDWSGGEVSITSASPMLSRVWDAVVYPLGHRVAEIGKRVESAVLAEIGRAGPSQHHESCPGQFEIAQLAAYDLLGRLGVDTGPAPAGLARVARNASWWWPYEGTVILTDRPAELHRGDGNLLHRDGGPAQRFAGGPELYAWYGKEVPRRLVTAPATKTDWRRADVTGHAVIGERMGYGWVLANVPGTSKRKADSDERGTLWRITEPGSDGYTVSRHASPPQDIMLVVLRGTGTDGKPGHEVWRVPPDVGTVAAAAVWAAREGRHYFPWYG